MFGFSKTKVPAPTTVAMSVLERPSRLTKRPVPIERLSDYAALAQKLKTAALERGDVLQRLVADFLWENDIEIFSYSAVVQYLSALADKEATKFCWRPLRDRDVADGWGWNHAEHSHDYYWASKWECRTYEKAVPYHILQNVDRLETAFPGKLFFFVTDYASNSPDPFIMVTARDMGRIVFGVWDEPAFFVSV